MDLPKVAVTLAVAGSALSGVAAPVEQPEPAPVNEQTQPLAEAQALAQDKENEERLEEANKSADHAQEPRTEESRN